MAIKRKPRGDKTTANWRIQDANIRHGIWMTRLQSAEANALVELLDEQVHFDVLGTLAARLDRVRLRGGFSKGPFNTKALENLFNRIDAITGDGYQTAFNTTRSQLVQVAEHEAAFQIKAAKEALEGLRIEAPSKADIRSVVTRRPIHGRTLDRHFEVLEASTNDAIKQEINRGLVEGLSTEKIIANVKNLALTKSRNQADTIAHTVVNHTTNHASEATWATNPDDLVGIIYIATLDTRTTLICASLDGEVFAPDEGPRPPQHYGCRSRTAPVFKKGGGTPEPISYNEWLLNQSVQAQIEVLGKTRAQWFRDGEITIKQMVDQFNQPLTLDEIREREGLSV